MASQQKNNQSQLKAEVSKLRAENKLLKQQLAKLEDQNVPDSNSKHKWRLFGVTCFIVLSVIIVVIGNLLFWTGNTLVNPSRFSETVTPIIKDETVQKGIADYTTNTIYSSVNVNQYITNALPPRAEFLAPTLTGQLKGFTDKTLSTVLARPKFQDRVNRLLTTTQSQFVSTLKTSGSDGTLDVNDLYNQVSASLSGTTLSFLANKKLPSSVGQIQVLKGNWIKVGHRIVTHIDLWRTLAIIALLICLGLGIYLSKNRRRIVVAIGISIAAGMILSLIVIGIVPSIVSGNVNQQYASAVQQAVQIFLHPLVVQTATLLVAFVLIAIIAWISGSAKNATLIRKHTLVLANSKLHPALFGEQENVFTNWLAKYKAYLEWSLVALLVIISLITRLTPTELIVYVVIVIVFILIVEILAASE